MSVRKLTKLEYSRHCERLKGQIKRTAYRKKRQQEQAGVNYLGVDGSFHDELFKVRGLVGSRLPGPVRMISSFGVGSLRIA